MIDTHVTVVGNLVAEPRFVVTSGGVGVTSFRLASTPRRFDRPTGEWKDGETMFTNVTCWRALAENVANSLKKGSSVIVLGKLSVRPYETKDGDKRLSVDIEALAVGPELSRVVTVIKRAERGVPVVPANGGTPNSVESLGLGADDHVDWASHEAVADLDLGSLNDDGLDDDIDLLDESEVTAAEVPATETPADSVPQLTAAGGRWRSRGAAS